MKLQKLCHMRFGFLVPVMIGLGAVAQADDAANAAQPSHDYPTVARVEYVNECIAKNGGKLAAMYQCSCVIDLIAKTLSYDDFVEQSTFAKYATLPGQGGSIFRDSDEARQKAKDFRHLESDSERACGLAASQ
jgi:hypothetical protein